ncbi:MAG TPA: ABC transporter ATP-binding protein, partial [Reyranella sp.]
LVAEALELVHLPGYGSRYPRQLSGGQQQRVAVARALVVEPRVLLLDEPLSNLDAKVRQRLRAEIRRLQRRVGITTIYVTHDQEEALAIADQVVLMNAGTVVQAGTPEDVYRRPADAFAADFLGVTTRLSGRAVAGRLEIAAQSLPYSGTVRGAVEVVLRSSDLRLAAPGTSADTPELAGRVEESLFLGTHYRHYVRVGNVLVMIDGVEPVPEGPVRVIIPADALRVYEAARA